MDKCIECARTGKGKQLGRRTRLSKIRPLLPANVRVSPGLGAAAGWSCLQGKMTLAVEKEIVGTRPYPLPVLALGIGQVTISSPMKWGDDLTYSVWLSARLR